MSAGGGFVEDDHPQFDLVLDLVTVLMGQVIIFHLVGRDHDLLGDILGAQRRHDVLVEQFLTELLDGAALGLQGFHERDAVAEAVADAVLHELVGEIIRQLVTFDDEIMEDELAFDQLLQAVAQGLVVFLPEQVGLAGVLPLQRLHHRQREFLDLRVGDGGVVHDGLDAVGQLRAQRQSRAEGQRAN